MVQPDDGRRGAAGGRLDDVGQLGALLLRTKAYDAPRLLAFHTAHHEKPLTTRAPLILPGMARVTTEPFSDGYGALVHSKKIGETFVEQWVIETGNVETVDRNELTMTFGAYTFTGTPMAYPKRLPRHADTTAASERTHWLPLSNGASVTIQHFYDGVRARVHSGPPFAYAIAQMARAAWPPTAEPAGGGWQEVLQNPGYPNSNQKMWVYAESSAQHEDGYVSTALHLVWQVEQRFVPVPHDSAFGDRIADGSFADWKNFVEATFDTSSSNEAFRYVHGEVRRYETPPDAETPPTW
jgi:hypothetical protein